MKSRSNSSNKEKKQMFEAQTNITIKLELTEKMVVTCFYRD